MILALDQAVSMQDDSLPPLLVVAVSLVLFAVSAMLICVIWLLIQTLRGKL